MILNFLGSIFVEPVAFFIFFGQSVYRLSQSAGIYEVLCEMYYHKDPKVTCGTTTLKQTPYAEDFVQQRAAEWMIYAMFCYIVPATLAGLFFGAWGDRVGRTVNILIGISGVILGSFGYILVVGNRDVPLFLVLIIDFFAGMSGFFGIIFVSCYAFISDRNVDAKKLTIRMVMFNISGHIGEAIGNAIAGKLSVTLGLASTGMTGVVLMFLGYVYTCLRVPQVPPVEMKRRCLQAAQVNDPEQYKYLKVAPKKPKNEGKMLRNILQMQKASLKAYFKPREGHKRLYIILCAVVYLLLVSSLAGMHSVTSLYAFHRPLSWSTETLGYYNTCNTVVTVLGTFFGIFLFKKWLKLHDVLVIVIGMTFFVGKLIVTGLACASDHELGTILMFASCAFSIFSGMVFPTIKSFISTLVNPDEVGKVFSVFGLSIEIGVLFGVTIYGNIYKHTLSFYPGFVFLFATVELLPCIFIFIWIYFNLRRTKF